MKSEPSERLEQILIDYPQTQSVVNAVIQIWPEHAAYLAKNFAARSQAFLDTTEVAAGVCKKLMGGDEARFAADYRWTCDRLRDEEIFFHREGRYRLATFAEAYAEVYSNHDYMERYVHGLLLSQILWYNHVATLEMFRSRVINSSDRPFDYLEVGPGHGLMVYFASQSANCRTVEAWDVSLTSLQETAKALQVMGVTKPVTLTEVDILTATAPVRKFDLIVISEVLEHLEDPVSALRFLGQALSQGGRIFINIPINSPSPDHIYLFSSREDIRNLVEGAGLEILEQDLFATQGREIESAFRSRISVSAGVLARPRTLGSANGSNITVRNN